MNKNLTGKRDMYPGGYVPFHEAANESAVKNPIAATGQTAHSVAITEFNKCYDVAVPIPAAKKENIVVYVEDHIATIAVFREHKFVNRDADISFDELAMLYKQKLSLPDDADADFIHAEYDKGVLHMFISKSNKPSSVNFHPVAVY
jgi:HSP20 family molecular chaperone IbpA